MDPAPFGGAAIEFRIAREFRACPSIQLAFCSIEGFDITMKFRLLPRRYFSLRALPALLLFASCVAFARADDAKVGSSLTTETLAEQVEIRRDTWGVPHVLGENVPAAVFGFAYAQAEDHMLGIMRRVLNARGELAAAFGEDHVEGDIFIRRFHIYDLSRDEFSSLPPHMQDIYTAFSQGLNLYVENHREELPPWVGETTPVDILSVSRVGLLGFAFNRGNVIEKIQNGEGGAETAFVLNPDKLEEVGSNMWALGPERTESGKAILMGNPHLPWSLTWYEGHLTVPGEYNIYGAAFIGSPIPTIAFNDALGWSHTVNYPDAEDVYSFALDPENADHILYDDASHALAKHEVSIQVRDNGESRTEEFVFWDSEFGPVIHRTQDRAWVLRSAAYEELGFTEQWFRMGKAQNLEEFQDALAMNAIPMFNAAYADRDGNIYYHWMATLPVRAEGQNGQNTVEVTSSDQVWQEIHPSSDMPQLVNPEGGYVQNSNDPPWFTTLYQLIDKAEFPVYMPEKKLRLRSQHGLELVHNRNKFTLENVVELKHSMKMMLADRIRDDLVAAAQAQEEPSEILTEAADVLAQWDGLVRRESRGGVLFEVWWEIYSKDNENVWRVPWDAEDPAATPRGLGDSARGVQDLILAAEQCNEAYGSLDVAWGEVHRVRRGDLDLPINGGPGSLGCFRVINTAPAEDGKQVTYGGDGWVFAVEFGDVPKAYSILAYGQSEKESSIHHTDQVVPFVEGRLKPVNFTEASIQANLEASYRPGER